MPDIVPGKNVNVEALIDGIYVVIGCAVSCSFEFENELIGKTDVNAGLFRKKRVRISDCRGSVQGLTTIVNTSSRLSIFYFMQEAIRRAENTMRFVYEDEAGNTMYVSGLFLVRALTLNGDASGFGEFDLSLEGTGGITVGTVNPVPELICPEVTSDSWETVEGETSISGPGIAGRSFEGKDILEVDREGTQFDYNPGTPGNREFTYDGVNITFNAGVPFNPGERVFVVWQDFES